MKHRWPQDTPPPAHRPWPFADPALGAHFERLCREALSPGGTGVAIEDGIATVSGSGVRHGLDNLASTCNQLPVPQWPSVIAQHFLKSSPASLRAITEAMLDAPFEDQQHRLVVRLQPENSLPAPLASMHLHRVDLPGTWTLLALDLGASIVLVPRFLAERWGKPIEHLFLQALQNLPGHCDAEAASLRLPAPVATQMDFLEGGSYAAAAALRLRDCNVRQGEHGNLVCTPVRESLISWPIDEWPSDHLLRAMLRMATARYAEGPYPVSPHVYWRKPDGTYEVQRARLLGESMQVLATPDFAELRRRLRTSRDTARG